MLPPASEKRKHLGPFKLPQFVRTVQTGAVYYLRGCFYIDDVNAFYELRPEAELQKALAQKSQEALFDNFAGTHVDMLLAQYDEDDE